MPPPPNVERSATGPGKPYQTQTTFGATVILVVESQSFTVHKDLIARHSPFFNKAFNSTLQEGVTGTMELKEVTWGIVLHFVHWLYYSSLRTHNDDGSAVDLTQLLAIWLFAERHEIEDLQNAVVSEYVRQITKKGEVVGATFADIVHVYSNTTEDSVLRELMVDDFIGTRADFAKALGEEGGGAVLPSEFLVDLAAGMQARYDLIKGAANARRGRMWLNACDYHQHGEGIKCGMVPK